MRYLWTFGLWATLLSLPFATLAVVNAAYGPATHTSTPVCTRACHDRGCRHLLEKVDPEHPVVDAARRLYRANIAALRSTSLGYRDTNLVVYVVGLPAVFAGLLLVVLWREPPRGGWGLLAGAGGLLLGLVGSVAWRPQALLAWGTDRSAVYWACTDFCIHMGNLTGLTYEGFNFLLFLVGFPATLFGLTLAAGLRVVRCTTAACSTVA